jgi:lipopolysaccharide transport system permease protein
VRSAVVAPAPLLTTESLTVTTATAVTPAVLAEPTVIRPPRGWQAIGLPELWRYRELLYFLVWRDIKVRYKQTVIGAAWAIIQPVFTMVIFALIFGKLAGIKSDGTPYPVFVYAGILPWLLFSSSVTSAGQSLITQASLLTKVYFPRLYLPAAGIGVALVDFLLGAAVYAVLLASFGQAVAASVLLLPLLVLLTVTLAYGVGLLLASVAVIYRDFRIAIPFLLQTWMFLSPIVYPLSLVREKLGDWYWLALLNPLTGIIAGFRSGLLGTELDGAALVSSLIITGGVLGAGILNFKRIERRFADIA